MTVKDPYSVLGVARDASKDEIRTAYMYARNITLFDDYSFDKSMSWSIEPFADIIGRHFRQPKEGLGNDASATAHMWRTLIDPSKPL